ncbi:hypothetical protein MTR67_020138 [Solanum verrucosum]|uniref:Uncharacterized protein n=1 Tax=Solanum verrucosum TaxID=315347 RepID=A0AAF0TVI2_SOLVR|nr:hypothetical protein MTR67_020138 [Solanum verrucosum]
MSELKAKCLKKAVVPSTLIQHPSPANLQSTRLAIHMNDDNDSSCWVYIASGSRIYKVLIPMENSLLNLGKEDLLIPEQCEVLEASVVNHCPHRSEIQSIMLAETESPGCSILGSVDSYGHLIVSRLDASGDDVNGLTYSVSPRDCGVGEGSWAGLCFNPTQRSMAAVAHSFSKTIDVYDQDIHVRTLRPLWHPSSLMFMQNLDLGGGNSVLAVAEGCQLTIWDLRMKEKGGCVRRICGSVGDNLYAVCNSSKGTIAAGGADRTVTVYDPRSFLCLLQSPGGWSAVSRWLNCSKYEITGLAFSSVDPEYVYVQGVDYEVVCGRWRESKKIFSYRGDSNWLGFSKCSDRDVLGGWSDSGSIFVADIRAVNGLHLSIDLDVPAATSLF